MRMLEHRTAKGTGEAVKASYETAWERTRARIDREIATGDSLFSILARMNRLAQGDHEVDFWRKQVGVAPLSRRVLDAWDVDVDERRSPYIPAVINGRYGVRTAFSPMRYLAERIGDANVVVENGVLLMPAAGVDRDEAWRRALDAPSSVRYIGPEPRPSPEEEEQMIFDMVEEFRHRGD